MTLLLIFRITKEGRWRWQCRLAFTALQLVHESPVSCREVCGERPKGPPAGRTISE